MRLLRVPRWSLGPRFCVRSPRIKLSRQMCFWTPDLQKEKRPSLGQAPILDARLWRREWYTALVLRLMVVISLRDILGRPDTV